MEIKRLINFFLNVLFFIISVMITLSSCYQKYLNPSPTIPTAIYPKNKATNIPLALTLKWQSNDVEKEKIKYELYFGKDIPLKLIAKDLTTTEYEISNLEYATRYYWKIVAIDEGGSKVESPIYSFYTKSEICKK